MSARLDFGEVATSGRCDQRNRLVRRRALQAEHGRLRRSEQTQYRIAWDRENAGGYAALLTITTLDDDQRKILLDTGWNTERGWTTCSPARASTDAGTGRDRLHGAVALALRHFWGIESTLKHNPRLSSTRRRRGGRRPGLAEGKGNQVEDRQGRSISICKNDVSRMRAN